MMFPALFFNFLPEPATLAPAGGSAPFTPVQHQNDGEPAYMIFIRCLLDGFLHYTSFATRDWSCDRHRSVRLVVCDVWRLI